jgi:hypothetical protein
MNDILNKPYDRFDLEQDIMDCWKVTDDIKLLYDNLENMDEDRRMNYMLGLMEMYGLKFEKLWSCFEQLVQDKKII